MLRLELAPPGANPSSVPRPSPRSFSDASCLLSRRIDVDRGRNRWRLVIWWRSAGAAEGRTAGLARRDDSDRRRGLRGGEERLPRVARPTLPRSPSVTPRSARGHHLLPPQHLATRSDAAHVSPSPTTICAAWQAVERLPPDRERDGGRRGRADVASLELSTR